MHYRFLVYLLASSVKYNIYFVIMNTIYYGSLAFLISTSQLFCNCLNYFQFNCWVLILGDLLCPCSCRKSCVWAASRLSVLWPQVPTQLPRPPCGRTLWREVSDSQNFCLVIFVVLSALVHLVIWWAVLFFDWHLLGF